jgi:hypothetical protein
MPVLTDDEYNELRPHIGHIRFVRDVGQWTSTADHSVMAKIQQRISGEISNLGCSGCVNRLYGYINLYLDDYENR